jgi:hypothetical protein
VINTGTTIVTFLMAFLIQNTQNRDTMAMQIKLAELIIALKGAQNQLAIAEELSEQEFERLHEQYKNESSSHERDVHHVAQEKETQVYKRYRFQRRLLTTDCLTFAERPCVAVNRWPCRSTTAATVHPSVGLLSLR